MIFPFPGHLYLDSATPEIFAIDREQVRKLNELFWKVEHDKVVQSAAVSGATLAVGGAIFSGGGAYAGPAGGAAGDAAAASI